MALLHLKRWHSLYAAPNEADWYGRDDESAGSRIYQIVQLLDLRKHLSLPSSPENYAILGFCSDEGVRRNQGWIGAAEGPIAMRHALGKLPVHANFKLYDVGNIYCKEGDLETAQAALAAVVTLLIQEGFKPLVIGGGHETAWGHFRGLARALPQKDIGIINLDSHFELRSPQEYKGNSNTSFQQIATYCKDHNLKFDYTVIGIQRSANTSAVFSAAKELNVHYLLADDYFLKNRQQAFHLIDAALSRHDYIYLSLSLDVLSANIAPAVSALQVRGLEAWDVAELFRYVLQSGKVISVEIAELAPRYDKDNITANLASLFAFDYLHQEII